MCPAQRHFHRLRVAPLPRARLPSDQPAPLHQPCTARPGQTTQMSSETGRAHRHTGPQARSSPRASGGGPSPIVALFLLCFTGLMAQPGGCLCDPCVPTGLLPPICTQPASWPFRPVPVLPRSVQPPLLPSGSQVSYPKCGTGQFTLCSDHFINLPTSTYRCPTHAGCWRYVSCALGTPSHEGHTVREEGPSAQARRPPSLPGQAREGSRDEAAFRGNLQEERPFARGSGRTGVPKGRNSRSKATGCEPR